MFINHNFKEMTNEEQIKEMVRQKYSEIALQDKETNALSCCGSGGCSDEAYTIMSEDYSSLDGYNPDADLGLGCGLPTQYIAVLFGLYSPKVKINKKINIQKILHFFVK